MSQIALVGLGLVLDLILGDPRWWPHPVRAVGWLIDRLTRFCLDRFHSFRGRALAGFGAAGLVIAATWAAAWLVLRLAGMVHPWLAWLIGAILVWNSVSLTDLIRHVKPIRAALDLGDIVQAREDLSLVVGRETDQLDRVDVAKAALETLAENLSDGVIAPLFYLALGGPALAWAYKAVNTLDSMIGYKHEPYKYFGFASAKIDDLANYIPARLSALIIILALRISGRDWAAGWRVARRDHAKSSSPNAGWPEAALAGGLGVQLLGAAVYAGRTVTKPILNPAGVEPGAEDLTAGLNLTRTAGLIGFGLCWVVYLLKACCMIAV